MTDTLARWDRLGTAGGRLDALAPARRRLALRGLVRTSDRTPDLPSPGRPRNFLSARGRPDKPADNGTRLVAETPSEAEDRAVRGHSGNGVAIAKPTG